MSIRKTVKQCKSCPWRVDCVPDRDIPNGYSCDLHRKLDDTIRSGTESMRGPMRAMACHHSEVGAETPCAGWLANQLGSGNNIGVRLSVIHGHMPYPELDGEQHERFENTLPVAKTNRSRRAARRR